MLRRVSMLVGVVLIVASCEVLQPKPPSAFIEGTTIHTISVGGLDRVYRLRKPVGLSAPASLVVMLHGGFGKPAREHIDDVAFIKAAVADVTKHITIDSARVYATGVGNGAMMSFTLACNTTLFVAIGPVSGTQLDPCRSPHPVSVMAIHGSADPNVPYGGGEGRLRPYQRPAGVGVECVLAQGRPMPAASGDDRW